MTLKQLTKLSVTNARSEFEKTRGERRRSRRGLPNWREMEKIVIFLGRPLSSEVTQKEREGKKTLTSASSRRSQRKDAFMNEHREQEKLLLEKSIKRQFKISKKLPWSVSLSKRIAEVEPKKKIESILLPSVVPTRYFTAGSVSLHKQEIRHAAVT